MELEIRQFGARYQLGGISTDNGKVGKENKEKRALRNYSRQKQIEQAALRMEAIKDEIRRMQMGR